MGDDLGTLPAVPSSCCARFFKEQAADGGRKSVTVVTPSELRNKRARDLTVAEARKVVCFLVCRGDYVLTKNPYPEFKCKNNSTVEITTPGLDQKYQFYKNIPAVLADDKKTVKEPARTEFDSTKDFMAPVRIGIKALVKLSDLPGRPEIALNNLCDPKTPARDQQCGNVDMRNALGLYKLLEMLVRDFGATEMLHAGIGAGRGPCTDCHNTGRAIDFSGLKGRTRLEANQAEEDYDIRVLQDWGMKKILDQSGKPAGGQAGNTFFFNDGDKTFFRLLSQGAPAPTTFKERLAVRLFSAVYDFAVDEYVERGFQRGAGYSKSGPAPADPNSLGRTQIGNGSFILNPDADGGNGQAHANHMHFQIGPTDLEDQYTKILGSPAT